MVASLEQLRQRLESHVPSTIEAKGRAAVAVIFRERSGLEVMLIRRTDRPGDPWSGHMAFPGGRYEERDPHPLATAVRETREEIDLDLDLDATLIGRLDDQIAYARGERLDMAISPFVFGLARDAALTLSDEVAEVVWAPMGPMMRGEVGTELERELYGQPITLPGFVVGPHIVWGLTHRMLINLFALVAR
ncbi:MAG: CoA pyrophosphatase [Deltaproteobacteria bacterium]|nr:CoA pyrophosphatase [Deltaproteobacteria bacterium]